MLQTSIPSQSAQSDLILPLRIVIGEGKFEEMMVASQEIAGSTAQLVIASRVKAKEGSNAFNELRLASRVVSEATGRVVAVAKDSSATADSKLVISCFDFLALTGALVVIMRH